MKFLTMKVREGSDAYIEVFLRECRENYAGGKRPCVLIFPGGAYVFCGDRDSEPNALAFLKEGFQAVVLRYSCRPNYEGPFLHDEPLKDAAAAITLVREHAAEWGIDPERIAVFGVSAGGHLAASLGVFYKDTKRLPGTDPQMTHPNVLLLTYPVITGKNVEFNSSVYNLSGCTGTCPENDIYSTEDYVTADTCPTFIWASQCDQTVNAMENSFAFARALKAHGVPYDLHLYSNGWHGLSLADTEDGARFPHIHTWVKLEVEWLRKMGLDPDKQ